MKHIILLTSLLILVVGCGKRSGSKSSPAPVAEPVVTENVSTKPLTPKEEQFLTQVQTELKLPSAAVEEIKIELEKTSDPYLKANIMFCAGAGVATFWDRVVYTCRSFKGDRIHLSFFGVGYSFAAHTELAVLYAKKGSRVLKEGTYTVNLRALHLGIGGLGLKITNDNESINWRMKGLSVGLGVNASLARMTIKKI